jgi:hypothetical protein
MNIGKLRRPCCGRGSRCAGHKKRVCKDPLQKQTHRSANRKGKQMKESSNNFQQNEKPFGGFQQNEKPFGGAVHGCGSIMSFIAHELAVCEEVLNGQRREVLQVRQIYFSSDGRREVVLTELEFLLNDLKGGIQYVRDRLAKLKPNLLIASAARRLNEEEYPDEFDEE